MKEIDYGFVANNLLKEKENREYTTCLNTLTEGLSKSDNANQMYSEDKAYTGCIDIIEDAHSDGWSIDRCVRLAHIDKLYDVLTTNNIDPGYFAISLGLYIFKMSEKSSPEIEALVTKVPIDIMSDVSQNIFNDVIHRIVEGFQVTV